ncbi:MAG: DUF4198 domain-containing protein [Porticoccaceae bacterium]|nr:DUF4198 domain-containing protein [Porticoccaceae bacterium]
MKVKIPTVSALVLAMTLPLAAEAHRGWLLPAATVLSGEEPWVTVDGAISNDIFHTDHAAMRLDGLKVVGPDGEEVEIQNGHTGKYRSTFDLQLTQQGTYRVFSASGGLNARWVTDEGERRFWPGRGETPAPGDFEKKVPKDAKELTVTQSSRRIETFITAGVPTDEVLAPTNQGLELVPVTHPNDLFAEEEATFRLLIDGEAAVGAKVTVLAGGMRYRNSQDAIEVETDDEGAFSVTWPDAGMYWLSASYRDDKATAPATARQGSYVATFEVLPQ